MSRSASSLAIRGLASAIVGALSATSAFAQTAPAAPAQQATLATSAYTFSGDAAITINVIKADKTADFEMIVGKLREALLKSAKPERAQQAASWKVFKAAETGLSVNTLLARKRYAVVRLRRRLQAIHDEFLKDEFLQ